MELTITYENWSHTCGDGCCYTWGTDVFINGNKVSSGDFDSISVVLEDVLKYLGYKIKDYEQETTSNKPDAEDKDSNELPVPQGSQ